ncbi:glutamine ABC transporter permease GlnP [Burkholderia thailandensis]|uniref:Glutamine ABC transporter, permease protein n=1 Tax=Burkholderia thailandensis (strain ATCC 700388 / DSM 13276 / CCUG 48851 / CIP 106301 / E264) TaxID=271848 RepID=Q2T2Q6_BURTA|nr:glutamine ABC transporter permease GlnP [Burkholderia thailandensis]ABC36036.1 glutamine ABC transporter, permease protein [Burkholderia thailandensis E264]MBS2129698.1 glutamine ABC transporter permease GlnP [Burkholderia thailandensis]MCS6497394.1 glutamine ABC transporter permease GlnP [Burkholderia thailandensis]QRA14548.1 glutamine ABC transporter permease GlnP [Burkholderia thailandensis]
MPRRSERYRELNVQFDWSAIWAALPDLTDGVRLTVFIAFFGLAGGFLVGMIAGMFRAYGPAALNVLTQVYIELIRGTPIVVQVMFLYFALPMLAHIRIDGLTAAIVAITLNSGAYLAEVVRGALLSIPKGVTEAGLAMGLSMPRVLVKIVGPLAFRRLIAPLGNQCIVSLKDTSLFIVIGVGELTRKGQEIIAGNFQAVEIWTAVAAIYLALTGVMTLTLRFVEKRMRIL